MQFLHESLQTKHKIEETVKYGKRHYITPVGTFPSVTTVLSMADQTHLIEWRQRVGEAEADRITREAAARGTRLHSTLELYLNNDPEHKHMSLITKELFLQVKPTLDSMIEKVHAQEIPLYSKALRTAGRCDLIATIGGKKHIVDFKNSRKEKNLDWIENYRQQVSAYGVMANEIHGTQIKDYCILIANLEDNYPTVVFGKLRDHIGGFLELRAKYDEFILQPSPNKLQ